MRIERRYTKAGRSPYADIAFRKVTSEIRNPDGSVVFRLEGIDVPEHFSQVASDILAQKYFRKAGVPARLKKVEEETVPSFLWRGAADEKALDAHDLRPLGALSAGRPIQRSKLFAPHANRASADYGLFVRKSGPSRLRKRTIKLP